MAKILERKQAVQNSFCDNCWHIPDKRGLTRTQPVHK